MNNNFKFRDGLAVRERCRSLRPLSCRFRDVAVGGLTAAFFLTERHTQIGWFRTQPLVCLVLGIALWSGMAAPLLGQGLFVKKAQSDPAAISAAIAAIAESEATDFAEFQAKAKAWRALPVKPKLSEEVQRFRVLAEDALHKKNFAEAVGYYAQGLAVEPLWPQGYFNAALLQAEQQHYKSAVRHMKRYLELCPDAKDAEASRQKTWIWEEEAKRAQMPGSGQAQPKLNFIGLHLEPVTPEIAKELKLADQNGALVKRVLSRCPADLAGVKEGDVIIEFNGKKVADRQHLVQMVLESPPGTRATVKYIRDCQKKVARITPVALPISAWE